MTAATILLLFQVAAPTDLTPLIDSVVRSSGVPAFGAAIVDSRGLIAVGAAGARSADSTVPVTIDDQWHLGSCTKTMTATLVARLIERRILTWETTVGSVFGARVHPGWRPVPISWLLTHRSGASLNFRDDLWQQVLARGGSPVEQRAMFAEQGLEVPPTTPPNTATVYSNAAFIVAAAMVERLTGRSWEELIRAEVFEPLGMTRTGFGPPGSPGRLDQPVGHSRRESRWRPAPPGPDADIPLAAAPAGAVHTTLGDWARFVAVHLRGALGDSTFLAPATWRRLHAPDQSDWTYSAGWKVTTETWAGGTLLSHLGSNNLWVAEASLAPSRDVAVLIVTNAADDSVEEPFKNLLSALITWQAVRR